jgi:hypothetical protein
VGGTPIQFEGEWFVRLVLDKNLSHPPPFKLGGPHELEITIAPIENATLTAEYPDSMRCVASGRWLANGTLTPAFEYMSRGMLPDGRDPDPAWEEFKTTLLTKAFPPEAPAPIRSKTYIPSTFVPGSETCTPSYAAPH